MPSSPAPELTASLAEPPVRGPLAPPVVPPPVLVAAPIEAGAAAPEKRPLARSWPVWLWRAGCAALEWLFGLASLILLLAALASVPVVNFLSLGYLLEASGRIARTGRFRDGFIGIGTAARIGSMVAGTWLMLLPLRALSSLAYDASLVPGNPAAPIWRGVLVVATAAMLAHIAMAWYCGGRLRHFFWPLLAPFHLGGYILFGGVVGPLARPIIDGISRNLAADLYEPRPLDSWFPPAMIWSALARGRMMAEARDAVWDFALGLRLPHYFWLGLRGFVGAAAWLAGPVLLLIGGTAIKLPIGILVGWAGAFALAAVLLYLPFLQAHFACQNRFVAMFEWGHVRQLFRRAPLAFWFSLTITLLFALPLYLLKIEATPREVTWLPCLFFVLFIYPARLLTGWALARAMRRERPRFFLTRWLARLAAVPVVLLYVLIVYFSQYTSWYGQASLFEQHPFLLPVPFLGL